MDEINDGIEIRSKIYDFCPENCEYESLNIDTKRLYYAAGKHTKIEENRYVVHCENRDICKMWAERTANNEHT